MSMKSTLYSQDRTRTHIYEDGYTEHVVVEIGDQRLDLAPEQWDLVFRVVADHIGHHVRRPCCCQE